MRKMINDLMTDVSYVLRFVKYLWEERQFALGRYEEPKIEVTTNETNFLEKAA